MRTRIQEINKFFESATLPNEAIISTWPLKNVSKFVETHLRYVNNNNKEKFIKPYLERLEELKQQIENKIY